MQKLEKQAESEALISDYQNIHDILASSPYFLKISDAILSSLDRDTLAELIVAYLYYISKGKSNGEFVRYVTSNMLPKLLEIVGKATPMIVAGLVSDKTFRNVVIDLLRRSASKFGF